MENRKSGFLTFIFSFIPGAGEMYLGLMKKGSAVMLVFWGLFFISMFLRSGVFTIGMPIVWFYSFFDTINLKHLSAEERERAEAKFMESLEKLMGQDWKDIFKKRHALIGAALIFIGIYAIFESILMPMAWWISDYFPWLYSLVNSIPTLIVAFVLIVFGIHLVKGGKTTQSKEKDYIEFKGDDDNE